jgi:hypothetical protein
MHTIGASFGGGSSMLRVAGIATLIAAFTIAARFRLYRHQPDG